MASCCELSQHRFAGTARLRACVMEAVAEQPQQPRLQSRPKFSQQKGCNEMPSVSAPGHRCALPRRGPNRCPQAMTPTCTSIPYPGGGSKKLRAWIAPAAAATWRGGFKDPQSTRSARRDVPQSKLQTALCFWRRRLKTL